MNNDESKKFTIDTGNSAVAGSCQFERVLGSAPDAIDNLKHSIGCYIAGQGTYPP